jgi:hypothetical protein
MYRLQQRDNAHFVNLDLVVLVSLISPVIALRLAIRFLFVDTSCDCLVLLLISTRTVNALLNSILTILRHHRQQIICGFCCVLERLERTELGSQGLKIDLVNFRGFP